MELAGGGGVVVAGILVSWFLIAECIVSKDLSPCSFPAIYNFGDSNSDTGGISAAFYPMAAPSGETYFHKPVGRASDGRLIIDFIADHLGLPYLSAYLDTIGTSYRHGANFATGGSTIRRQNESVFQNGVSPFSLDIQTAHFDQFKTRSTYYYQHGKAVENLHKSRLPRPKDFSKALYIFDIGQNDLAAGFRTMTKEQLNASIPDVVNQLATAIQHLYQQGARNFWIHNTGPIGCLAFTLRYYRHPDPDYVDSIGCDKYQNEMATEFNEQLKGKIIQLRHELAEASLTYVDVYAAKYGLISNPMKEGFERKEKICCGYDNEDTHVWCGQTANVNGTQVFAGSCGDPSSVISWDGVHYTDAANHWIAKRIIDGSVSDSNLPITHACHRV